MHAHQRIAIFFDFVSKMATQKLQKYRPLLDNNRRTVKNFAFEREREKESESTPKYIK